MLLKPSCLLLILLSGASCLLAADSATESAPAETSAETTVALIDPANVTAAEGEGYEQVLANYEGRPQVRAVRLLPGEQIELDGVLDEAAWERAVPATNFIQQDPANGAPSTEPTEVRFAFDDDKLYMGVYNFDSEPEGILGNQMLRDGFLSSDDRFMWVFDTYLNGRTGYFFEINPGGAMGDSLLGGDGGGGGGNGRAWDGIWTAKVRIYEGGWIIELEIPFKTLNFDPNAPAWGVNFQRTIRRRREEQLWTNYVRNQSLQTLRNAGLLTGIEGASQGHGLDFRPFFVGNASSAPGQGEPGALIKGKYGGDIYYSITPQLRAQLTFNTDFAETDVDQRQVNLTQFPLFFPERRGFFLEGTGFFDFSRWEGDSDVVPFFSRRIGLANGIPQRIEFGTKLTGQIGLYDLGILHVRTAAEAERPSEDFTVIRPKRRFFRESYVGLMYTRRAEGTLPDIFGPAATAADPRQTIGADFYLGTSRFRGNQNLQFSGFWLQTSRPLGASPDSNNRHYGVRLDYPNDRYQVRISAREVGDAYDPAIGFNQRGSIRDYRANLGFFPRPQQPNRVRRYQFFTNLNVITALDNTVLRRQTDFQYLGVQFQTGDQFQARLNHIFDRLAFPLRQPGGIVFPTGNAYGMLRYNFQFNTADQRTVQASINYSGGQYYGGTRRELNLGVNLRPKPGMLINLNTQLNRADLPEGSFSTTLERIQFNWQFGPWVSLANTIQYDNQSRVLGSQSRFRWIVKPGQDIFLVYTHNWLSVVGQEPLLDGFGNPIEPDPIPGTTIVPIVNGIQTLNRGLAFKTTYIVRF